MGRVSAAILSLAAGLLAGTAASGAGPRLDPAAVLERSEAAIGRQVGDNPLFRPDGSKLRVSDFRGRPIVVSLVYTSCSSVCPTTTQSLRTAVGKAREALGRDAFEIVTLGFDARNDTPVRMAAFAKDQSIDRDPAWHLASGRAEDIAALLDDFGFTYEALAGGFEHITQTTILDAEGRVYRHVYGDAFPIPVFVEPLKELVFGTRTRSLSVSDLADRIRFLCTVYDPVTGRYRTDFAIAFGITIGGLSLILMGWIVIGMWRGNRPVEARNG
ncbi:SCO family protein [Faunimonas sp. B44]|uniref:SCO family protein n=1 Tax=Faunimonas sp. B44 TaxID=3461493 RepID=UPI004044AF9E